MRRAMDGLLPPVVVWNRLRGRQSADFRGRLLASKPEIDAAQGRLSTSALECPYLDCRKLQRLWAALQHDDAPPSVYLRAYVLLRGLIVGLFLVDTELCTCVRPFLARLCELGFIAVRQVEDERAHLRRRYLGLLKRALVNLIYPEHELRIRHLQHRLQTGEQCVEEGWMRDIRYRASEAYTALVAAKTDGSRPAIYAHTLIGLKRLYNIEYCAEQVFADGVLGDFLEAGVCQGGAAIFMRALQVACGEAARRTWVADSFQGLPPPMAEPDRQFNMDWTPARVPWLAISRAAVEDNFRTYDLLSEQVCFLEGCFADTLPVAPVERLAILRFDADLYQSTREVLDALYDKVSPGGFVIVDDYLAWRVCQMAVDEFRAARGIHDRLRRIDWTGVYWQKSA